MSSSSSGMRPFAVIVAATAGSLGIGKNGTLPWRLAGDMAYFKRITTAVSPASAGVGGAAAAAGGGGGGGATTGSTTTTTSSSSSSSSSSSTKCNAVVMGRKTWLSIPKKFRPLAGRRNVVLSRNPNVRDECLLPEEVLVASSLEDALSLLGKEPHSEEVANVFVIGGAQVYKEAVESELCKTIFLTSVSPSQAQGAADAAPAAVLPKCDAFFPEIDSSVYGLRERGEPQTEGGLDFRFDVYERAAQSIIAGQTAEAGKDKAKAGDRTRSDGGGGAEPASKKAKILTQKENVAEKEEQQPQQSKAKGGGQDDMLAPDGNAEEEQYLDIIRDVLENGVQRGDRTGTGTLSKFGVQMRFSLRGDSFPLLTTKRVFWRGVAEELLWFVSGCTNAKKLEEKDIHIWDGNGSREFLDKMGFTDREEGDLGPVYGFQWRHFGAAYTDMHADYTDKGIDQLQACIDKIKTNPEDRRIILSAWNPSDLGQMALPPCHMFCQFYVADGELSCQMYQRSADLGLGVPFNIASYALLTRMVAQVCGLKAGDFVHTIGDAHVYLNHVEGLKEQLKRTPRAFPKLSINGAKTDDIDSFDFADFTISGYSPHKTIKMKMAV